jgi:hypothetical protein
VACGEDLQKNKTLPHPILSRGHDMDLPHPSILLTPPLPQRKNKELWQPKESRTVLQYRLVWATLKTIASSASLKFLSYRFTVKLPCYFGINRKLIKRPF